MRDTAKEVCNMDIFIMGDSIFGGPPKLNVEYPPFELLDAVTNYDIYGNMNKPPYAGQEAVDDYYLEQKVWRERAGENGCGYVPVVSPGYNDRGVRLIKNNIGLSHRLTNSSAPGTLFVAQLQKARNLVDPAMEGLLIVNSFNEWHEDTQIEPVVGESTNLPLQMTNGIQYDGYGELYLNILRAETCDVNCENRKKLPPIPEGITVGAYYYPWHGDDFHRFGGYLRDLLEPRHQPVLGEYDDTRPEVIAQHLAWSRQANI